jgi:hypothetical protein
MAQKALSGSLRRRTEQTQTREELLLAIQFRRWTHSWFELNKSGLRGRASRVAPKVMLRAANLRSCKNKAACQLCDGGRFRLLCRCPSDYLSGGSDVSNWAR